MIISLLLIGVDSTFSKVPEVLSVRKFIPAIKKTKKNTIMPTKGPPKLSNSEAFSFPYT